MPSGLQVWSAEGQLNFDTNDYTGRSLGAVAVGPGSGVVSDPRLATGIPWAVVSMEGNSPRDTGGVGGYVDVNLWLSAPRVYFSSTDMHWSRSGNYPSGWALPACTIYYGVR